MLRFQQFELSTLILSYLRLRVFALVKFFLPFWQFTATFIHTDPPAVILYLTVFQYYQGWKFCCHSYLDYTQLNNTECLPGNHQFILSPEKKKNNNFQLAQNLSEFLILFIYQFAKYLMILRTNCNETVRKWSMDECLDLIIFLSQYRSRWPPQPNEDTTMFRTFYRH